MPLATSVGRPLATLAAQEERSRLAGCTFVGRGVGSGTGAGDADTNECGAQCENNNAKNARRNASINERSMCRKFRTLGDQGHRLVVRDYMTVGTTRPNRRHWLFNHWKLLEEPTIHVTMMFVTKHAKRSSELICRFLSAAISMKPEEVSMPSEGQGRER